MPLPVSLRQATRGLDLLRQRLRLDRRLLSMLLLLPAAPCPAQEKAAPAAPLSAPAPEMMKTLKSVEELLLALDAQVKNLEAKYLQQRKQAAYAVSPSEKEAANATAAKLADLLKATTKERDALAGQIASMRAFLGQPSTPAAANSPAGTPPTGTPGAAPAAGSGK